LRQTKKVRRLSKKPRRPLPKQMKQAIRKTSLSKSPKRLK
jgi:hypothetical protein